MSVASNIPVKKVNEKECRPTTLCGLHFSQLMHVSHVKECLKMNEIKRMFIKLTLNTLYCNIK